MRATEVTIHNFRSIHDAVLGVEDISIIAGANNAGKSNLVDAIRIFYGDLKYSHDRDFPIIDTDDNESWIEIVFKPSEEELLQLKDEYKSEDGTFRVRNYLESSTKDLDGKARAGYYAYVDGKLSDTLFYGAKNVGSGKVGKIVYIPAVSKVDDHTKLSGPSALRDLIASIMNKVVSESPAYKSLETAFQTFESQIKTLESEDGRSLQALETDVTIELKQWEANFSLGIQNIQVDEMIKSLIKPQLVDNTHGGEIEQSRFGAGFQRHLIFTLIKLAAKYTSGAKKSGIKKKEFSPQLTWILFEEPEAFLHPTQEDILYDNLKVLVSDAETQVLLTTHSSRFVSGTMNELTKLIRVRRDGAISTVHQVRSKELDSFFDASQAADAEIMPELLDAKTVNRDKAMSALKIELWLQPQRAAAFFTKNVLLVEGATEVGLHKYLCNKRLLADGKSSALVVDCMGKYSIHRFMKLMDSFGIDHSVLYDGDGGGSKDTEVTKTIVDATGQYTQKVKRLDNAIESELGLTPLPKKDSHRKPQYLLYNLEAGLVDEKKLNGVIDIFNEIC
jgi:putative ATP-dependent endonuclease of OLD family